MSAVAGLAGLRPGEVAVLERGDVKTGQNGLSFLSVTQAWQGSGGRWGEEAEDIALPKTALGRDVFIPPRLIEELDAWCEHADITSGPLFLVDGAPPSNWHRALKKACAKAGVREVSPYGLRHTNATLLMEAGVPLGVIAEQLGNSVEVLVKHYLGWLQGSRESAPIKLQELLSRQSPPRAEIRS
jgi:integrase